MPRLDSAPFIPAWLFSNYFILCLSCPLYVADAGFSFKMMSLILQAQNVGLSWWKQCSSSVTDISGQHRHLWTWLKWCEIFCLHLSLLHQLLTLGGKLPERRPPTQHNSDACLMTGVKMWFLETSGLTFECCPWNLPKGPMLTLAIDVSLNREVFSLLSTIPIPSYRK